MKSMTLVLIGLIVCQCAGLCKENRDIAWDYLDRAEAYKQRGDVKQEKRELEELLSMRPKNARGWVLYGEVLKDALDPKGAAKAFSKAIECNCDEKRFVLGERAAQYESMGQWQLAVKDYSQALTYPASDDDKGWTLKNRGDLYTALGLEDKALADFTESIKIKPNRNVAYHRRAQIYKKRREWDKALKDIDEMLKWDKDKTGAGNMYAMRADIYSEMNKPDLAIAALSKTIELEPLKTLYRERRAKLYDQMGKHDLAKRDRAEVKKLDKIYLGE